MPEIGIRELKTNTSRLVQTVQKRKARYTITHRGKPVALLVPIDDVTTRLAGTELTADEIWDRLVELGKRLAQGWPEGVNSAEVLSNMRR